MSMIPYKNTLMVRGEMTLICKVNDGWKMKNLAYKIIDICIIINDYLKKIDDFGSKWTYYTAK